MTQPNTRISSTGWAISGLLLYAVYIVSLTILGLQNKAGQYAVELLVVLFASSAMISIRRTTKNANRFLLFYFLLAILAAPLLVAYVIGIIHREITLDRFPFNYLILYFALIFVPDAIAFALGHLVGRLVSRWLLARP